MTQKLTLKENIIALLRVVIILAIVTLISVALTSCGTSKSQSMKTSNTITVEEKVIIVDNMPIKRDGTIPYKVYRPETGTMQYIELKGLFDKGDTVYYRFIKTKPIENDFLISEIEGDHLVIGKTKDNRTIKLFVENAHSQSYEIGQLISVIIE